MSLDILNLECNILSCSRCKGLNILKETMSAQGYGSYSAKLLVVGQSLHSYNPDTPDKQIPFIGPVKRLDSGVILYEALEKAGYTKETYFITNIVKCHPPDNRKSTKTEILNCKSYLEDEIKLIKPITILTLGSNARDWFNLDPVRQGYVSVQYKKATEYIAIQKFVVAYHPSYIRRYGMKYKDKYIKQIVNAIRIK